MKEKFREIYETNLTVKKGQTKIKEWLNHAQVFFRESASTIENHFEGICNYFLNRTTSGVMEGINNRIKLIMRQGYGFSNFNKFRNCVLACFSLDKLITISSGEPQLLSGVAAYQHTVALRSRWNAMPSATLLQLPHSPAMGETYSKDLKV
jgi:hypothetical protein